MKLEMAKGTRDFLPGEKMLRDFIFNTLKDCCERYGFNGIETPIIERYETLAAKFAAGEESDAMKEVFIFKDNGQRRLALRFDLTVPFSRFIALHPNIKKPFKKYMAGEVFRDGPIKTGRYRQFTQFDPDIVGSSSMLAEAELLSLIDYAMSRLGLEYYVELNNKKIMEAALSEAGVHKKKMESAIISIDKLKKIGEDAVLKELAEKGYDKKKFKEILFKLKKKDSNKKTIGFLKKSLTSNLAKEGIQEIEEIFSYLDVFGIKAVVFEPSLARGLSYYTGPVFEVFLKNSKITSSAAAGGRYDRLISNYLGLKDEIPTVGFSFGVDVLLEALKEKNKLEKKSVVEAYIIPIGAKIESIKIADKLRKSGINTDMDILGRGISKNLQYADSYNIPYVVFVGKKELEQNKVKLRNMKTGEEVLLGIEELVEKIKSKKCND